MRDIECAIEGENRYTVPQASEIDTKIITSLSEWKAFYAKLIKRKIVAIDTETENLNRVYDNKILTIHFCLDGKLGWCLPFYHAETPFTGKELEIIKTDIKHWFEFGTSSFLIYHTAKFDKLMFKRDLGVRFFNHDIYDIAAGEFLADENRKFITNAKVTLTGKDKYTLEHIALNYGGLAYLEGDVSKSDRKNMASLPLKQIAIYASKDVVLPYWIAKFQIQEANRRGENYKNFKITNTKLCSDIYHVMVDMEYNGALLDKAYIQNLLMPNSVFMQELQNYRNSFKEFRSAKKVNKEIRSKSGKNYKAGLFGEIEQPWQFSPDKEEHLQMLFFDVLQLKPLAMKKIKGAKTDKAFISEYKDTVPEVKRFGEYRQAKAILNTFVKGMHKHLIEDSDCKDSRIRSYYNFLEILTLRSSSGNPNLQNVPSRGKSAKLVKREFISPKGKLLLKGDFNAHEVRGWGNISKDLNIAKAFLPGIETRRKLRLLFNSDPELHAAVLDMLKKVNWKDIKDTQEKLAIARKSNLRIELEQIIKLESEGDIHRKNYEFFFNVPAIKVTDEQRQSVKQVVFGVLYGKSAASLAKQELYTKEIRALEKKYSHDPQRLKQEIAVYIEKCQDIINTMFERFQTGKLWIDKQHALGRDTLENVSVFGAVRHLSGYLHTEQQYINMMNRRGPNSLIQGPSSNVAYIGARLMQRNNFQLQLHNIDLGWLHTNMVHDSTENECNIDMSPLSIYYFEHSMTTLAYQRCRDTFGWDQPITMEFDLEYGATLAHMKKFDYTITNLLSGLDESIDLMSEELQYSLPKKQLLKAVKHNWYLVWPFREKELKAMTGYSPSDKMLLTPEIAKTLNWKTVEIT
jgi:DNA polymerase I-like protein with 3'-5' exonuclease and polymerase domains